LLLAADRTIHRTTPAYPPSTNHRYFAAATAAALQAAFAPDLTPADEHPA
jgi:hypothetical protein